MEGFYMLNLLFKLLLVIGSFLGGYVIGQDIVVGYNQYKCNKILDDMLKNTDLRYNTMFKVEDK